MKEGIHMILTKETYRKFMSNYVFLMVILTEETYGIPHVFRETFKILKTSHVQKRRI